MTLVNDLISVETYVKGRFPDATTEKQSDIRKPPANSFVVRFTSDDRETETAAHYRIHRAYQIVYTGVDAQTVLDTMDALSRALYQAQVIPISGTLRYIRVNSFSFAQPFTTENGMIACIGVLDTEVREARDQVSYDKIMHVYMRRA